MLAQEMPGFQELLETRFTNLVESAMNTAIERFNSLTVSGQPHSRSNSSQMQSPPPMPTHSRTSSSQLHNSVALSHFRTNSGQYHSSNPGVHSRTSSGQDQVQSPASGDSLDGILLETMPPGQSNTATNLIPPDDHAQLYPATPHSQLLSRTNEQFPPPLIQPADGPNTISHPDSGYVTEPQYPDQFPKFEYQEEGGLVADWLFQHERERQQSE